MTDTPERINALADDWMLNEGFDNAEAVEKALRNYATLLEQVAAHERECAGKWVKVTERLPKVGYWLDVFCESDGSTHETRLDAVWPNGDPAWTDPWEMQHPVTHWLDARMPGEEP